MRRAKLILAVSIRFESRSLHRADSDGAPASGEEQQLADRRREVVCKLGSDDDVIALARLPLTAQADWVTERPTHCTTH